MPPVSSPGSLDRPDQDRRRPRRARALPPRHRADADDARPARAPPSWSPATARSAGSRCGSGSCWSPARCSPLLVGLVWHGFAFWLGTNTFVLGAAPRSC